MAKKRPKRSAPADQDRDHTSKHCGGQLPKSTDIPAIYKNLSGKKYVSRAPKRYEKVKTRYPANQRKNNPHRTMQLKQVP